MIANEGKVFKVFAWVFCALLVVLCLFPLIWMVFSSFKLDREVWPILSGFCRAAG